MKKISIWRQSVLLYTPVNAGRRRLHKREDFMDEFINQPVFLLCVVATVVTLLFFFSLPSVGSPTNERILIEMVDGVLMLRAAHFPAYSAGVLYGLSVFTRIRARRCPDGKVRVLMLKQHLKRLKETAHHCFPNKKDVVLAHAVGWEKQLFAAVREYFKRGGDPNWCYIHIEIGPTSGGGAMLRAAQAQLQTYIAVSAELPLYGNGLVLSPEREFFRPKGVLTPWKVKGLYAELFQLKQRARSRLAAAGVVLKVGTDVETVLFNQEGHVVELGCANLVLVDESNKTLFMSAEHHRFSGLTEWLVVQYVVLGLLGSGWKVKKVPITEDMLRTLPAASLGTAGGIVRILSYDGETLPESSVIPRLQELHSQAWNGEVWSNVFLSSVIPEC
ncbi:MAG: aminotransferase class IV [Candidatus Magasanikbacteria bacterium]|nr:aminotransferase class IV [Candidatus Magasanikbacteria bacterium]